MLTTTYPPALTPPSAVIVTLKVTVPLLDETLAATLVPRWAGPTA